MTVIDRIRRPTALGGVYFQPSIRNGLVGLFQPRRNALESIINRAPGGINASMVGSPQFTLWGATLNPENYIETALPETNVFTLISIARKNPLGGVSLIGTLEGSTSSTPYANLTMRSGSPVRFASAVKTTPVSSEQSLGFDFPAGDTGFEMIFASCDGASTTNMLPRNPAVVAGGNPRTVALAGPRDAPVANWRIGAARVATSLYPHGTEHALDMIYNRALTTLEGRAIYAEAAAYYRTRGIAI